MTSSITLRGHHVLCLLTYRGAGYSEKFKENFNAIVTALERGHPARIVAGYDSICHNESTFFSCPRRDSQKCKNLHEQEMDRLALSDLSRHAFTAGAWTIGSRLHLTESLVSALRKAFAQGAIRRACHGCLWGRFCTTIAQDSFCSTLLFSPWRIKNESLPKRGLANNPKYSIIDHSL